MARSTTHYAEGQTNNILKRLHNKLRPAGTPVQRVEYIIELLLLRIFEIKLRQDKNFNPLRKLFEDEGYKFLFSYLLSLPGEQIKSHLNKNIFPFYSQILSKARKVFKGNLPQKVQDNLVLIEEVFANSSFSTNVQSGNMTEIIGLVSEIDEATILKTDILGDAIESALSETGGTQDIGLYRTPEHIRQMVVAMAGPTFYDIIFDPACGTGGFLFDAYHYCLEKVTKDKRWPSQKCPPGHPKLNAYFEKFFRQFNEEMPDKDTANRFYREGIGGIEYLGMIRKMAAINLYIRGLNPANIEQGDSLRLFDPAIESNLKTVILSNPPFGAERDQPAYPNVWQEYARESETTVLFVKLMFDLLKKGGRCAVVVSEGFLTWDKASARNLRKMLLEEANLKAIISLPQGVFVSKQGQGAKTSVLYFEKGEPTKWVWYYKIDNDGFSIGVNRKPIPGCQIPEVIEVFTNYVKKGKVPPETKRSFTIPAEWIKTLDPRLKERIRKETREQIIIKNKTKKDKLITQLEEKKDKGKITEKQYQQKLEQFDTVLENKIQNEISKRIEKAHLYSFNFQTYRSDLTEEQIKEWKETLREIKPHDDTNIDEKYLLLQESSPETALRILASFNPKNALEIDIAREYLVRLNTENMKLKKLKEILTRGIKYPLIPLRAYIFPVVDKIKPSDYPDTEFVILGVSNKIGVFVNEKKKGEKINQSYYRVKKNQFCYNPYRINVGSIGLNPFHYKNQIISGAYNVFAVDENGIEPKFLFALFKTKRFLDYVSELATGGVRMDFKLDYLKSWKIPLPPLETQRQIVEKIEKQKEIIEGAEKILDSWEVSSDLFEYKPGWKVVSLGNVCKFIGGSQPPKDKFIFESKEGFIRLIQIRDYKTDEFKTYVKINSVTKFCNEDDIMTARYGPPIFQILRGLQGAYNVALMKAVPDESVLMKDYLFYFLQNEKIQNFVIQNSQRSAGQSGVNTDLLNSYQIALPPLDVQRKIVQQLDKEMEALEKVKLLKEKAEKRIEEILEEVWGDN